MRKIIIALFGMGLASGCYVGVEDNGDDGADRGGKTCYYSYSTDDSSTFGTKTTNNDLKKNLEFDLTIEVDVVAQERLDPVEAARRLRWNAGLVAQPHLARACQQNPEIDIACQETCGEAGLKWDSGTVTCEECDAKDPSTCKPSDALREAGERKTDPFRPWGYYDEVKSLQVWVGALEEDREGGWQAQVKVEGSCLCACGGEG